MRERLAVAHRPVADDEWGVLHGERDGLYAEDPGRGTTLGEPLGKDLTAPGVEDCQHFRGARERRGGERCEGRVLREGGAGAQGERPRGRGGYANTGEGARPHPGEHTLDRSEPFTGEVQCGVDGGEQGLGCAAGGDGDLGQDLAPVLLRAGEGYRDDGRRGVEGEYQHRDTRSATGPRMHTRRVAGVWWEIRTTVGSSMTSRAGSAHSMKVTASGSR